MPSDGAATQLMPFAAVIRPATLPCSGIGTASDAPPVNPGRVNPKPSEASAKDKVIS